MPHLLLTLALAALLGQRPLERGMHETTFDAPGGVELRYGISIPRIYDPKRPVPLVLALHPGGTRFEYYGSAFMQQVIAPALGDLNPIIVAPDCPTAAWTDADADAAVLALLQDTMQTYAIDRRRVLVTGFSMGGRGTWFMASEHADLFTGAIVIAGSTGNQPVDALARVPTYVIHSRADQVVPFDRAEQNARELEKLGRPIRFEALRDIGHFEMPRYVDAVRRGGRWIADRWKD